MEDLDNNINFWAFTAQRLKQELTFVRKSVKGCSSIMFSKTNNRDSLTGKIDGIRFDIDLTTEPRNLNHSDFMDIVQVLINKKTRDDGR